jgi:hypothetical protein
VSFIHGKESPGCAPIFGTDEPTLEPEPVAASKSSTWLTGASAGPNKDIGADAGADTGAADTAGVAGDIVADRLGANVREKIFMKRRRSLNFAIV